ncbi:hypothetical protein CTEN210_00474 [Chaetoceros tenuissimus]|uniref:Uncharacterized protein n=1 Tax=Chaetoceros tenuissimus TaxID=426638 RepID=A0AAD3GYV2_9STRA|nr:hypothetical protein CTEN210_00474 [Chaetoceros tenuissimus]
MLDHIKKELKLSLFSKEDANEKEVDLVETFSPSPKGFIIASKIMLLAVSTFNFVTSILNYNDNKEMWPMFLTKWGFMLGYSYLLSSTVTVISPLKLMKLTWGLFAATINIQMFITINYWVLVYNGSTEPFSSYYEHGIFFILLALDGFAVHRYPLRFKQIFLVWAVLIPFLIWSIIHSKLGIGNSLHNDRPDATDDDALYGTLNWTERPKGAGILSALLICVAVPLIFIITWGLSVLVPRRYVVVTEETTKEDKV